MKKTEKRLVERLFVTHYICDVCKKEFSVTDDFDEIEEFIMLSHHCGYHSIFEDEMMIRCDICQHCIKEKLGEHLRIEEVMVDAG